MGDENCRMTFPLFLRCLKECAEMMDETEFFYKNEAGEEEYCIIGYITEYDPEHPYWVGHGCDMKGGADYSSADDLVDARVFGGKSIRERWNEIRIITLGMCDMAFWFEHFCPFISEVETPKKDGCWRLRDGHK